MRDTQTLAQAERELTLVLLADGEHSDRHARVSGLLDRLGVTIEVDFGRGWLVAASAQAKSVIVAHRDVAVAGGVHQRSDRTLPRRIRRQVDE